MSVASISEVVKSEIENLSELTGFLKYCDIVEAGEGVATSWPTVTFSLPNDSDLVALNNVLFPACIGLMQGIERDILGESFDPESPAPEVKKKLKVNIVPLGPPKEGTGAYGFLQKTKDGLPLLAVISREGDKILVSISTAYYVSEE